MEKLNLSLTEGPSLVECNFKTKELAQKSKKGLPVECQYSVEIKINIESKEVLAVLSVKTESANLPFYFDVKSQAIFKFPKLNFEEKDREFVERRAIFEAVPYIFPFLKEMVADLTRKAYLKPFYLPAIELNIDSFEKVDE